MGKVAARTRTNASNSFVRPRMYADAASAMCARVCHVCVMCQVLCIHTRTHTERQIDNTFGGIIPRLLRCCSVLQCVAVCCSVLQCDTFGGIVPGLRETNRHTFGGIIPGLLSQPSTVEIKTLLHDPHQFPVNLFLMCLSPYVCVRACARVCVHVCMCTRMCVCVCVTGK